MENQNSFEKGMEGGGENTWEKIEANIEAAMREKMGEYYDFTILRLNKESDGFEKVYGGADAEVYSFRNDKDRQDDIKKVVQITLEGKEAEKKEKYMLSGYHHVVEVNEEGEVEDIRLRGALFEDEEGGMEERFKD